MKRVFVGVFSVIVGLFLLISIVAAEDALLAAPQNFRYSIEEGQSFKFTWDAVDGADFYLVEFYQPYMADWFRAGTSDTTSLVCEGHEICAYAVVACKGNPSGSYTRGERSRILLLRGNEGNLDELYVMSNYNGVDLFLLKENSGWVDDEHTDLYYCILRKEGNGEYQEIHRVNAGDMQYPLLNPFTGMVIPGYFGIYYHDPDALPGHDYHYSLKYSLEWTGADLGQAVLPAAEQSSIVTHHPYPALVPAPTHFRVEKSDIDITAYEWKFDKVDGASSYLISFVELDYYMNSPTYLVWENEITGLSHVQAWGYEVMFATWVQAIGPNGRNYSIPSQVEYFGYINPCKDLSVKETSGGAALTWTNQTEFTGFRFGIYRREGNGTFKRIAETEQTKYTDPSIESGKKYEYYVVTEIVRKGKALVSGTEVDTVISSKPGNNVSFTAGTGSTITINGINYTVSGSKAVVTGPKNKNAKKLTIPKTITASSKTYKVTEIKAGAFKDMKKLTTVTIGENVKTIGKSAFQGCMKLKAITIKSRKLTSSSVKSNAFKDIYKKASFKCPTRKKEEYKKILLKKGAPKTCKFK